MNKLEFIIGLVLGAMLVFIITGIIIVVLLALIEDYKENLKK